MGAPRWNMDCIQIDVADLGSDLLKQRDIQKPPFWESHALMGVWANHHDV
jgi:hypothetical protein